MSIGKRILWVGLLLTVAAALWPLPETEVADNVATTPRGTRSRASGSSGAAAPQLGSVIRSRPVSKGEIVDLFPRQGWSVPSPANAAPPTPLAPPLPFTYGGRYT